LQVDNLQFLRRLNHISFKTVHASVRPPRIAILVDKSDKTWQETCLRIIEVYSRLWGGAYNIIIPTDGETMDERFWTLLQTFDPDHLYRYGKTGQDLYLSQPAEYQQALDRNVERFLADFSRPPTDVERRRITSQIDQDLRRDWLTPQLTIGTALHQDIKARLAPFFFQEHVVEAGAITADSGVPWPLTDVAKIAPTTEHVDRVAIVTAASALLPRLWFSPVTGLLNDNAIGAFEAAGIKSESLDYGESDLHQLIELIVTGLAGGAQSDKLRSRMPFHISMLQLGLYRSLKYAYWEEPLVLVAGNSLDDFCFYYCLSRLRDRVVWVLPSITDRLFTSEAPEASSTELRFLSQLHAEEFSTQHHGRLALTSMSLDNRQIEAVIEQLNVLGYRRFEEINKIEHIEHLVRYPLVAYERDNFQRDIIVQLQDDRSISPFATPKPKNFNPVHPSEHRYITQLSVAGEGTPQHFHLGPLIVSDHRLLTNGARISKQGPAYFCPNVGYFGGDIDTVLVRPYLYLPPLHKLIGEISRAQGFECRSSDKGIYSDECIAKWGGLPDLAAFLRDNAKRGVLDTFLDKSPSKPGNGVFLTEDRRRYLDFNAVRQHVGDDVITLLDDLIGKQVMHRGLIFQCSFCRNASWFSISDVGRDFKCHRCGRIQVYKHANWKLPEEPAWFYKLDELVYQGYQHGMTASLLALDYLRRSSSETFSFSTDREFWRPRASKPDIEADFFCVLDGVFTVGEAKTDSSLGPSTSEENAKIRKYKRLVADLCVGQIVFATTNEEWSNHTVERVTSSFSAIPYVRIQFLSAADLLQPNTRSAG
jgi:hypothetical protein